jgi:predicted CoA-substrate-specific enzyme activase
MGMRADPKSAVGICTGASTVTLVEVEANGAPPAVRRVLSQAHEGNPKSVLCDFLEGLDLHRIEAIAVTGRRFKELLNLTTVSEPHTVEYALKHVNGHGTPFDAVISAGGETFMVYELGDRGQITKVYTGNKCASGTGEFFVQQTRRMDVSLENAIRHADGEQPYCVSGRCSVFCKSDCTHATNKGVPKGQVVAGLGKMMSEKVLELLKNTPKEKIMMVGGTTRVEVMVDHLRNEIEELVVPEEALYFEALGAALWALENPTRRYEGTARLFSSTMSQFDYHPPLKEAVGRVTFAEMERGVAAEGDHCVLGLDVGSTTTKAVLLRESDLTIIASEYLRTNGDPVSASRACYRALRDRLDGTDIIVRGLGVTGSGRKIAGLHALTGGVINEIIAHAEAACHFDPEVDTIFEIGGQDAKYTYVTNGVASDYAMNEACSAGTGSFLEESAKESLGIEMENIAEWALEGNRPPNFNDQCAAFISSDIKNAFHEGIPKEDIAAGLVYSICMNYVNRVKGARPVGKKVFMQGGVCYNRAVPLAMAALSGKEIVVPPEPGLMGAYGVALEVKKRIDQGLMREERFDLRALADREVEYKDPFVCTGGRERCDIGCSVNRVVIEDRTYPFGGACNLYYNVRHRLKVDTASHDLVVQRQRLVFEEYAPTVNDLPANAPTVGIPRTFLVNTYYPLFAHFFKELGLRPMISDELDQEGLDQTAAPFCYPCEMAHGFFKNLLERDPDMIFLPHISGVHVENGLSPSITCPLLQGEPFYLRGAFEDRLHGKKVLTPHLDLSASHEKQRTQFEKMADQLGVDRWRARAAYDRARAAQDGMRKRMLRMGEQKLREIESDPQQIGVVLFGRPYNAFVAEANKGIPHKFASRGITVIPVDFLDLAPYPVKDHMYWSIGQMNLKGAEFIKDHPQLFGTYITNFSCGPDSFIVGYFRDILEAKPSLTLELDNHTADTGLETRIEAFLDIVARYRKLQNSESITVRGSKRFKQAVVEISDDAFQIVTTEGEKVSFSDPRVRLVFSSMNQFISQAFAAAFRSRGIRTHTLPAMTEEDLKLGRGNTTCKECLPLQLTTGALIRYLQEERPEGEITGYFMPTADGPCRLGQYKDFIGDFINNREIRDTAVLSLTSGDGYGGLGSGFKLLSWKGIVAADVFEDVLHTMLVVAEDPDSACRSLEEAWSRVIEGIEKGGKHFKEALRQAARDLRAVPRKLSPHDAPQVLIVGEIYVRKEGISRRWLPERLASSGIICHVAPVHEWVYYVDWLADKDLLGLTRGLKDRLRERIRTAFMVRSEKEIKQTMAESGWYIPRLIDIDQIVAAAEAFLSPELRGEAILTIGGPMLEVGKEFCGAIAIGPFGCMPNRLSESILNLKLDREHLLRFRHDEMTDHVTRQAPNLPFLAIESDGSPFPQLIEARLESFIVQALRIDKVMQQVKSMGVADRT